LLPVGIQNFEKIRNGGYCYIDKTASLHRLITGSTRVGFLSRPQGFGKSLLCSTLKAIFEGKRELFEETGGQKALAIASLEWDWKPYPVIVLDLSSFNYDENEDCLESFLHGRLDDIARHYGIELRGGGSISTEFISLIYDLHKLFDEDVAVIIDDCDAPLLATINIPELHERMRSALHGFYAVIKAYGRYLRFAFLASMTEFFHTGDFSGFNNVSDLTLDSRYADLCGFTEMEACEYFEPEITEIIEKSEFDRVEYMDKLRAFYYGYRFTDEPLKVYNPAELLQHLQSGGEFRSHWQSAGSLDFLAKLIDEQQMQISDMSDLLISTRGFDKCDIRKLWVVPLLYRSGYLTISDYDKSSYIYTLDFPNEEARACFARSFQSDEV
jgi:hypothetical protein